jgi:hypothetical protein
MSKQGSIEDQEPSEDVGSMPVAAKKRLDPWMGSMLFAFGGLIAGLAACLCVYGPKALPAQAELFQRAAAHGLTGGALLCASLELFALSMFARALGRNVESMANTDDQGLLLDQLTTDLAITRTSMQELRVEFVYLKDQVTNMGRDLPTSIVSANESSTRDAMYRLAASLDQVGARLEQRIRSQQGTLESTLQEVQQSLQATCEQVTQLGQTIQQSGPQPGGWEVPSEPPAPPVSLGVLDHMADESSPVPDFGGDFGAPLPGGPLSYEEKLLQLAQLLNDPRVRAAADNMTRSRGL